MLKLRPAGIKWWGKPLVTVDGRPLPAELEVKCPKWNRRTPEQRRFEEIASERAIPTDVVEWGFDTREKALLTYESSGSLP